MKNLKYILSFLAVSILYSCLDTEENIAINADNSGTYSMTMDLGEILKMAKSMGGDETNSNKIKEKKDTIIYLKDLMNATDSLTAHEKALYKDAQVSIKLDEEKDEMKIVMNSPFKNLGDLTEIKNNFLVMMNKLKAFEEAAGDKVKPDEEGGITGVGAKSANPVGDQFTFVASPGVISNTINNVDAFRKLAATDSSLSMMTQMASVMGDFNYHTIIVLPKAVKGYDGPGSTISNDKKTVTFFTTLTEMLEHPEKVSYEVKY
jgi:hypothetical protein